MRAEVSPAYVLVDYAWAVLSTNDPSVWDRSKYGNLIPIVPLAEEPELDEFGGPHIVYGYAESATGRLPEQNVGNLTFAIYDQNFRRLTRTLTILRVAFERQDQTAKDVNKFSTFYNDGQYLGIRFGSIDIGFTEGGSPEEAEGARQSALISIRYDYFCDYQVTTNVN